MNRSQDMKKKFRASSRWVKFRKALKKKQGIDPITGSKLSTTANCHHMNLDENNYTKIDDESHFVMLNKTSHDLVHFIFRAHKGWREAMASLYEILEKMDEINNKN